MSYHGNMAISFNLWDPQLCLVMSCQPCTQWLSLLDSLFFLFSFLSFYSPQLLYPKGFLSRSLPSFFFFLLPLEIFDDDKEEKEEFIDVTNNFAPLDLNPDHSSQRTSVTPATPASNSTGEGSDLSWVCYVCGFGFGFRFWVWLFGYERVWWLDFVWLLVVFMVVNSRFAVGGGGDGAGFGCGFYLLQVESCE